MAERDDDDERFQEKARPPKVRPADDERIRPAKSKSARPPEDDWDDEDDDRPRRSDRDRRPPERRRRDDDGVATIIPYRNGLALAGYYCGVFSLIPILGVILGPLALIFGIIGLRRVNRNPEVKGTGHAVTAIVLGGLGGLYNWAIVVFMIVGYLASRH